MEFSTISRWPGGFYIKTLHAVLGLEIRGGTGFACECAKGFARSKDPRAVRLVSSFVLEISSCLADNEGL